LSEKQAELMQHLEMMRDFRGRVPPEGRAYDSREHFIVEHGEWFEPIPLPREYSYGRWKRCFLNSLELVAEHDGLTYVEGYASHLLPIHHAWCVDAQGRLIDVTWPVDAEARAERLAPDAVYLGVRLPLAVAAEAVLDGTGSVLDDWERGWPIFKDRFEEVAHA
jgi:hypothetical protein